MVNGNEEREIWRMLCRDIIKKSQGRCGGRKEGGEREGGTLILVRDCIDQ